MPSLPTQSFNTIVTNTVAGIQGRAAALIDFSEGSTLRAIAEGFAGVFLWFQALVLQLLMATRLATSTGTDVDTYTADLMPVLPGSQTTSLPGGSPRLGAQASSGQVTFARFTAGPSSPFVAAAAKVAANGTFTNAGANTAVTVQTADGSQKFVVIADTLYANYSATLGGYSMPSSISKLIVPVQALTPGSAGNVAANSITQFNSTIPGIDTVTNVANFTTGSDGESDVALKARFAAYILGLQKGNRPGTEAAVRGAEVNIQFAINEGYDNDGSYHPGFYFIVADDGSGSPSQSFLQTVQSAADVVRPMSIQMTVLPPTVISATPSLQIVTATGYDHSTVVAAVAATIATNINSLGLGVDLPYSQIAAWAYGVPGVTKVNAVTLNGLVGDNANISTTKLAKDGKGILTYATVKCTSVVVS